MANTYHQIYIHTVFAVKYREAVIAKEWRPALMGVLGNLINETGCKTIIVNGVEDHVHLLMEVPRNQTLSDAMREIKTSRECRIWEISAK